MAFVTIPSTDVDAKSPVDDTLMGNIKNDLDDLDGRVITAGARPFLFELQGKLSFITTWRRSIAFAILNEASQPSICRFLLKKSGSSALTFDLRKHTTPKTPIIEIAHQYTAATSSIAQQGTGISTQSITRAVAQIATQSITHAKAAQNIQSIILLGYVDDLGSDIVSYNLDAAISADTLIGDSIVIAGATTGANNGTFTIVDKNRGGGNNVVISNVSGVAQTGVAGTSQEKIMSYNYVNPVDAKYPAGFSHEFATHTTGANNGTFLVNAINNGGNNLWVKNSAGVTQAGVAGTADTNLWIFAFSSSVNTTDYVVGEAAKTTVHASGGNNAGALVITHVNDGGNNLILHNGAGVAQGGAGGTTDTNRWKYNLPSDPTAQVSVNDTMFFSGHTNPLNDGVFIIVDLTSSTVVVYNTAGVAQASTPGKVFTTRKLVKFSSDQSANYSTLSFIEMQSCVDVLYNYVQSIAPFQVLEVNRGGGANFNVVIDSPLAASQASPSGYVQIEMKSIFTSAPSLAADLTSIEPNQMVVGTSTAFVAAVIPAQTPIALYITSYPSGDPQDLTVNLL